MVMHCGSALVVRVSCFPSETPYNSSPRPLHQRRLCFQRARRGVAVKGSVPATRQFPAGGMSRLHEFSRFTGTNRQDPTSVFFGIDLQATCRSSSSVRRFAVFSSVEMGQKSVVARHGSRQKTSKRMSSTSRCRSRLFRDSMVSMVLYVWQCRTRKVFDWLFMSLCCLGRVEMALRDAADCVKHIVGVYVLTVVENIIHS